MSAPYDFDAALDALLTPAPDARIRPYPVLDQPEVAAYLVALETLEAARAQARTAWHGLVGALLDTYGRHPHVRLVLFQQGAVTAQGPELSEVLLPGRQPGEPPVALTPDTCPSGYWETCRQLLHDLRHGQLFEHLPPGSAYAVDVSAGVVASWTQRAPAEETFDDLETCPRRATWSWTTRETDWSCFAAPAAGSARSRAEGPAAEQRLAGLLELFGMVPLTPYDSTG